jgi:Ca-activated chloride channel family protein
VFTDVAIEVHGIVERTRVSQRYVNPTDGWREGVYTFPLPEKAAVDRLRMQVGTRLIEGQIRERAQAKKEYEAAKKEGKKATLFEQERPNLFTTSVAHIGPDETVVVTIEYQQTLRYDDGTFRLRFPLAITPRYIPGAPVRASNDGTGWAMPTDAVPDADRVTPAVLHPSQGKVNPVALTVELDAGMRLAKIDSPYHPIATEPGPNHRYRVTLADGVIPADRDFELVWMLDVGTLPVATMFTETRGGMTYALLMVVPPGAAPASTVRTPREVQFIVDTSGSLEGVSMAQARAALALALERLQPGERFNVIEFNSATRPLFPAPMPVDPATLAAARSFVGGLHARGGTEMAPALEMALSSKAAPGLVGQVVFLTDGAVGNEDQLFALIHKQLGERRLFTVGIGPAPNSHFMTKAAQFGRGTFTFIGDVNEVQAKMGELFRKLESPVLTDVGVVWPGGAQVWPQRIPDLYAGEPLVISAAFDGPGKEVTVNARRGGAQWQSRLAPGSDAAHGVGALWARAKIGALNDRMREGAPEDEIRPQVLAAALEHHLVSKYTSLVAVDVTSTAPPGVETLKTALPGNLPAGLSHEAIFGGVPQTATPAQLQMLIGVALLLVAFYLVWLRRMRATRSAVRFVDPLGSVVRAARTVC